MKHIRFKFFSIFLISILFFSSCVVMANYNRSYIWIYNDSDYPIVEIATYDRTVSISNNNSYRYKCNVVWEGCLEPGDSHFLCIDSGRYGIRILTCDMRYDDYYDYYDYYDFYSQINNHVENETYEYEFNGLSLYPVH